jgi:hypothetical protein
MELRETAPRLALLCVGVLAGWAIGQVLDPVAPPVGRLVTRVAAMLRGESDG